MAQEQDVSEVHVIIGGKMAEITQDGMYVNEDFEHGDLWRVDIYEWRSFYMQKGELIDCDTGFHSWQEAMQSAIEHM